MTKLTTKLLTGDGRQMTVGKVVEVFKNIYSHSSPAKGKLQKLDDNNYGITNQFTTLNVNTLESIQTFKVYSLSTNRTKSGDRCIESVRCVSDAYEVAELVSITSDNGRYTAKLKSCNSANGASGSSKKQFLDIWERSRLLKTIDTSELETHGLINTDSHFSSFSWSKFGDNDKLLYVCQPKRPKSVSFFKGIDDHQGDSKQSEILEGSRGEEYVRREDWGETLTGIEHTIIAVLDVSDDCKITTINMDGYSLGEPQWLDDDSKIVSVAHKEDPRRLGIVYCNNRESKLVVHDWKSSSSDNRGLIKELNHKDRCLSSPRVSNNGDKIIYLSIALGGPHRRAARLFEHNIRSNTDRQLVDSATNTSDFFIDTLTNNCFTSDDTRFLFISSDHLRQHLCSFNLITQKLEKIKFPTTGVNLLDFKHDIILATGSEVNATPTLFVATLNGGNDVVAWHQIEDCIHLDEIEYETFEIPAPDDENSFISCLLVKPNPIVLRDNYATSQDMKVPSALVGDQNQLPTVVNVHGGPHSNIMLDYKASVALYARLGLQTLFINYRGSTGVSEAYLENLAGRVGQLDIDDCLHAIRYLVNKNLLNPKKLVIQGGSHGGFISAHLSCQEEFKFTCAVIRNPVINLATMHETSDIPDWAYVEALGQKRYDSAWQPDAQELIKMFECSPMFKVNKASVPTLMLLGNQDRRVNMYQGERWVDKLRALGVEVKCKIYEDNHALAKPEVMADHLVTAVVWILEHLEASRK